jgi:hypothetical protein
MSEYRKVLPLPRPVDVEAALEDAARILGELREDGALIGGVALAVFGIERFTKDVDLAVSVSTNGKLEPRVKDRDLQPLRIGGISIRAAAGVRVDFIDHRFEYRALYEEAIAAAKASGLEIQAGAVTIPVVPMVYLLAMKLGASRPLDERDVLALVAKPELDYPAAREIVRKHLGTYAARQLDRFARQAGRADAPKDYSNEPS